MILWFSVIAHAILMLISLDALLHMTGSLKRHRLGVTLLSAWSVIALVGAFAKATDPFPVWLPKAWLSAFGVAFFAWAVWDLTRLQRVYGTNALLSAAELARSFLRVPKSQSSTWALWASSLPKAAWLKSTEGVMLALNRHYEDTYGKSDYIGRTDHHMWLDEHANQFQENDKRVFMLGEPVVVEENAPLLDDPHRTSIFLKFPVRDERGEIVGIGGIELVGPESTAAA